MEENTIKRKGHFGLLRQTFLVAGSLILASILLGAFLSRWWLLVAAIVSIGFLTASVFGRCTLTHLLSELPFNPTHSGNIKEGSDLLSLETLEKNEDVSHPGMRIP
jgi:hypothetical protein